MKTSDEIEDDEEYPDLWCWFCERIVKLEEIEDVENDQPACPKCKAFLVEKI
jgi:Zn finger protein HypA/HybF involved in hydrogenase expression